MMGLATPKDGNWRLVCHNCEHQWPKMQAIAVSKAQCCEHPDIHVHDTDKPCDYCRDDYECKSCRDFADNFNPRSYPTPEEPTHPDCSYQHCPQCFGRLSYEELGGGHVGDSAYCPRCSMRAVKEAELEETKSNDV